MSATTSSPSGSSSATRAWPPAHPSEPTYVDDRLNYWAAATPDTVALSHAGRTWTWAQWHERVHRAAGGLRDLGIARGDVVAFIGANHPAGVEISLAAGSIGAAAALVPGTSSAADIEAAVIDSGAQVVFADSAVVSTVEGIRDRLPSVRSVIAVSPDGAEGDAYEQFLADGFACVDGPDVLEDDVVLIRYSGSDAVRLTHRELVQHTIEVHDDALSAVLFGIHEGVAGKLTP